MAKKKESNQKPVTKSEQLASKTDLLALRTDLKNDISALDQKVSSLDQKTNNIAFRVINLEKDVREIKENMMTKEDKNDITNLIDNVVGEIKSFRDSLVIRGHWLEEHGEKLVDHEKRIKRLETTAPSPS